MRDREVRAIIGNLKRIQVERNLSTVGMAGILGLSAGHLSMVYSGQRQPGLRFVRAAVESFPEVRMLVADMLRKE